MRNTPAPILDYAGPRPRTAMRLPVHSVLSIHANVDDLQITERTVAKVRTIIAMIFACCVLLILGFGLAGLFVDMLHDRADARSIAGLVGFFWLAEAVTLVFVVDQTWHRTIVEIRAGELRLKFVSLFGKRTRRCPIGDIHDLKVFETQNAPGTPALSELRFSITDYTPVQLFTDHTTRDVMSICEAMRQMIERHR